MAKKIDRILTEYISLVQENKIILERAILFGSYARRKPKKESDIDIAFVIKNLDDNKRFEMQVQLMLIATEIDNRIEPHPFSISDLKSSGPFISEILKTGIEINVIKTTTVRSNV